MATKKGAVHIGLRLNDADAAMLAALVEDEQAKAGAIARVSASGLVFGLIRAEYERRGLGGKKPR